MDVGCYLMNLHAYKPRMRAFEKVLELDCASQRTTRDHSYSLSLSEMLLNHHALAMLGSAPESLLELAGQPQKVLSNSVCSVIQFYHDLSQTSQLLRNF